MNRIRIKPIIAFIFVILILGLSSCNKKDDCCTIIDVDVQIHYRDQEGNNLINSSTEFDESNIKVYFKNGEEYEYVFKGNLDYPNFHYVEDINGEIILTVFPSNYYEENQSTTLIELNESVKDTLLCEFDLASNREICTRAWLNGVELNNRFIEVKK